MNRQHNSNGRDQFNVENNHGNVNIFYAGFHVFEKFVKNIFKYITPVLLPIQNSYELNHYSTEQEKLEVKKEELRIQQNRLKHEINSSAILIEINEVILRIQEKEFELKGKYFSSRLRLIQEEQDARIKLKLQEFQENWDAHNSPLLISKQDLLQFFTQQQGYELSILIAPPQIPNSLEKLSSLKKELEYSINNTIENYYLFVGKNGENTNPIVRSYQLFKRPIETLEARSISESLKPFPTLIINSEITDREVYITVTCSVFTDSNNQNINNQINLPPWNWEKSKESLDLQGQYSTDNIRRVRKLIADFHIVIAFYFSDLYYLNLDPYHKHKLLSFLEKTCEFPEPLQETIEFYRNSLIEIQDSIKSQILQPVRNNNTYSYSDDSPDSLGYGSILWLCIGMMLLFGFCHQKLPTLDTANIKGQHSLENYKGKSGIIQVNGPDKNPAKLRSTPNGEEIDKVQDGSHVTLEELSSDRQWQKVKTEDGKSGWVWAKYVSVDP